MFDAELASLLRTPGARVVAFDALGVSTVEVPKEFRAVPGSSSRRAGSPIAALSPESFGRAIAAYERARRNGRASTTLTMAHDGSVRRLELFDMIARFGCFIGVVIPDEVAAAESTVANDLRPRRAVYEVDATGVIQSLSSEYSSMLGYTADDVVGTSSLDLIHPDDREAAIVAWIDLLEHPNRVTRAVRRYKRATGEWLWCEATNENRLGDEEHPIVIAELVDVSREMAAQAALQQREALLDRLSRALPTGVLYLDSEGVPAFHNDRWIELTGMDASYGIGPLLDLVDDPTAIEGALVRAVDEGEDSDLAIGFAGGGGACRYGDLHLRPLRDAGTHIGLLVTLDDTTANRIFQMNLADQSRRDPLTAAYNRLGIEEALNARLALRTAAESSVAVLFVDLDRFKATNDTFGHAVGDQVLRLVAQKLSAMTRDTDAVGRIGGDEFVIVLGGETSPEHAEAMAGRFREAFPLLEREFDIDIDIAATVGWAFARDGDDFGSLMERADRAMYERKKSKER